MLWTKRDYLAPCVFQTPHCSESYHSWGVCAFSSFGAALSSTGSILSYTDLSDLSTVGTCDIFVYQMRHRFMWFARLADSIMFIKRVITCHWKGFCENAMRRMFSKMFLRIQYDQSMAEYRNTYHEPFSLFHHGVLIWLECFPWWYIALVRWPPCELNISCTSTTAESRAKIWYQ